MHMVLARIVTPGRKLQGSDRLALTQLEYSVVSPDTFGKQVAFRFQITPVVPGLIKNPIFGK